MASFTVIDVDSRKPNQRLASSPIKCLERIGELHVSSWQ